MKKCKKCDRELQEDEKFFCPRCFCEIVEGAKKGLNLVKGLGAAVFTIVAWLKLTKKN